MFQRRLSIASFIIVQQGEFFRPSLGSKCQRNIVFTWLIPAIYNFTKYFKSISGYCETYFDTFESLCDNIAGDSPMHTMFRRQAQPVKCPFKGPFLFSYTKGGSGLNKCSYPQSYLDSCSDHTKLQLNFQACIDVQVIITVFVCHLRTAAVPI